MFTTSYTFTKNDDLLSIAIRSLLSLAFVFSFLWSSAMAQIADPGQARTIEVGVATTIDGTGSISQSGLQLTYAWSLTQQPQGSTAALSDADSPRPSLVPDIAGDYLAELIVTDSEGNSSTAQIVLLTTNNVPPVANAGVDHITSINQSVRFDPEGTYDANGDRLEASWSILSAPSGSAANLSEDDGGRFVLTPDVTGEYSVELLVEDSAGAQSSDIVKIHAGASGQTSSNIAPVANAGLSQVSSVGQAAILDGSGSTDANGDMLTYQWSILSKPADSFSNIEMANDVRTSLTPDTDRTYILQLKVTDEGGLSDYDTIVLDSKNIAPLAISGGPDAGIDGAIIDMTASIDGSTSSQANGSVGGLAYDWSVLGLSQGVSEIIDTAIVATTINFPEEREGVITDPNIVGGLDALRAYNLISFGRLNSHADTLGRTFIGGDVQGPSSTFGTGIIPANGIDVLTVVGDIKGGAKNINDGGNVRIRGKAKSKLNLNGGGQLIKDSSLSMTSTQQQLMALSAELRDLASNSNISLPTGQPGPANLTAEPNADGVAVFDIADGNQLFKNNKIQQIELNPNDADTIIVNVGGNNVHFSKGNFVGVITSDEVSQKIIWNFYEANQLKIFRGFEGSILAPHAYVHNKSRIDGSVVADSVLEQAPIGFPLFGGMGLNRVELDPTIYALVQLGVTDIGNPSLGATYSTTVLTTGNKRPVTKIVQSGGPDPLTRGIEVSLNGGASSDGDKDGLSYSWSILSKPEESQANLTSATLVNTSITPDKVGLYVFQLTAYDGQLLSLPTTLIFEVQNTPPTAQAGSNQTVFKNDIVTVDGSGSSDLDGDDLTYLWALAEKPNGSQAELSDETAISPTFVADLKGDYVVRLVVNDGIQDSTADSVNITVENRAPIALATGTAEGFTGDIIMLSGAGSSDPDGDTLTYLWTVLGPDGSNAALSDPSNVSPMITPDVGGVYNFTLVVNDGEVSSPPASFIATISAANRPPVLAPVGDRTVALGSSLTFQLAATDPDGDDLYYSISQLPLPQGASFDVNTGIFTFKPASLSPETISLNLGVSDSALTDSETITITVNNGLQAPTTEYTGRIVDVITGEPISGVLVMAEGQTALTGDDGVFQLTGLPAGPIAIWIVANDGTELSPDGAVYGSTQIATNLIENVSNSSGSDIQLSPISTSEQVSPGQSTLVQNSSLGVTLEIPEDGVLGETDEPYTGTVGLTALSADQVNTLPPNVVPCQLFSLEPKTIRTVKPVTLTVSNYDNLPAGAVVDVWVFNGTGFSVVGSGTVSSDTSQVSAVLTNLRGGQLFALAPRAGTVEITNDQPKDIYVPGLLNEGNYSTSYSTPSYSSLGADRALTFVYNSTAANPSPIVSSISTIVESIGKPESISQVVKVGDAVLSLQSQTDLTVSPNGTQKFVQAGTFDASELPTGTYPVSFMSVSQYACSRVAASVETEISINNQVDSPIGTGWSIAEVSRLQFDEDGRVSVVNGDGTVSNFSPEEELGSVRETFATDIAGDNVPAITDFNNDGILDIIASDSARSSIRFYVGQEGGTNYIEDITSEVILGNPINIPPRPGGANTDLSISRLGDFNSDGVPEVAVVGRSRNLLYILERGVNGYEISQEIPHSDNSIDLFAEDFDGDGSLDLVTYNGSRLRFFTNDGTGILTEATSQSRSGIDMGVGDIDGDGLTDVVILNGSRARIRFNEGNLTFREVSVTMPRSQNRFFGQLVQIGDVDQDGDLDIVMSTLPNITYIENTGDRTFVASELVRPAAFTNPDNITLADVTGDGLLDILADERIPQPRYSLFKKLPDGGFAPAEAVVFGHPIGESLVTDMDGDGFQDLVSKSRFQLYVDYGQPPNNGNFNSPFGDFSSLVRNDDGTFSRRFTNGTVVTYSAAGLQTATTDRNGNETAYEYDADGRLISVTDPTGQVTDLAYGPDGLLETVTDPAGRTSTFTHNDVGDFVEVRDPEDQPVRFDYDEQSRLVSQTDKRDLTTVNIYGAGGRYTGSEFADGSSIGLSLARTLGLPDLGGDITQFVAVEDRMSKITDGRGNVTETEVNEFGSPIRVVDALGRETIFERNSNNLITAVIEPSSVTPSGTLRMNLAYDIRGNLISRTEAVGTALQRTTSTEYEAEYSRPIKLTDADGFETVMEYDEFGNRTRMTDPLGGEINTSYNARGRIISMRDKNDNLTEFEYDNFSRLSFTTDANNIRQQIVRDEAGNVIEIIDDVSGPEERRMLMSYDGLNRRISVTAADGGISRYSYDGNNNVVSVTDPTGVRETRSYDDRDRLETIQDPATGVTIMAYDPDSNLIRQTDGAGEVSVYEYDAVNRLVKTTDALDYERSFSYDLRDNGLTVTDARDNTTNFAYDVLDRTISRTNPVGNVWQFSYDGRDNRLTSIKPDGIVLSSAYDGLSRILSFSGGDVIRNYSYDAQNNLISADEQLNNLAGVQITFAYDNENRVTFASTSNLFGAGILNNRFDYEYDALDRRSSMTDSYGGVTAYTYDGVDRLNSVTTPQSDVFNMTYDLAGRSLRRLAPNASEITRNYESLTGRLARYTQSVSGTAFSDFSYAYTQRGNIASIVETSDISRTRNYSYDAIQRLTDVEVPELPGQDEAYTLDEEGNRITSQLSASHETDDANRLNEDASYAYIYDLNGNLTQKLAKAGTGLPDWSYRYDALDQMIEASRDGNVVESYRYDAFGRRSRISSVIDGSSTDIGIVNQGPDRLLDIANDNVAGSKLAKRYTHGANIDEPLQVEIFDVTGTFESHYTYHADHLGSIRYITDSDGQIVNSYDYDSYGRPLFGVTTIDQPFAYTGREWDAATGLYHYRARQYDSDTGRFMQEDPIGFNSGDYNIYRYVSSNPITFNDPSGLAAALEQQTVNRIILASATGAAVTSSALQNGGAELAAELADGALSTLSALGGQIACKFFSVAAVISGGSADNCGTPAGSIENDDVIVVPITGTGGGNCDENNKNRFQNNVDKWCKGPLSGTPFTCTIDMGSSTMMSVISRQQNCINARKRINNACFGGGDPGHNQAIKQAVDIVKKCYRYMN